MRIAMWSGPRNLSTAMMYSFAARGDCAVRDEPFYAAYLNKTGLPHPVADQIMAANEIDPYKVVAACCGSNMGNRPHFYMKLMAHHMLEDVPIDWAADCVNIHLIRHPARVIASYGAKRAEPTLDDIGFARQLTLYENLGGLVIDSHDIRKNPKAMLQALCAEIGLDWTADMLQWPAGGHADDGVWATHWYGAVHRSTGFAGPEGKLPELPAAHEELLQQALSYYDCMATERLHPAGNQTS